MGQVRCEETCIEQRRGGLCEAYRLRKRPNQHAFLRRRWHIALPRHRCTELPHAYKCHYRCRSGQVRQRPAQPNAQRKIGSHKSKYRLRNASHQRQLVGKGLANAVGTDLPLLYCTTQRYRKVQRQHCHHAFVPQKPRSQPTSGLQRLGFGYSLRQPPTLAVH